MNPELIKAQMKFHELQAIWWINSASNGHTLSRRLYHGGINLVEFTDAEKVSDAMDTAQRHLTAYSELYDKLCFQLRTE